jgi:hypothetical protein
MKATFGANVCALALLALPVAASAQFPTIPGLSAKPGSANLVGQQETLVRGYVAADKDVLMANSQMADALGLKDAAAAARATAEALTSGATQGNLSDADKVTQDSTNAVSEEMKKSPKLDAEAKKKFAAGLVVLTAGVVKYVALRKPVQDFATALPGASLLQVPQLQSGAYLVKSFPGSMKSLTGALNSAVSFARSNDIPVPPDATSALSAL